MPPRGQWFENAPAAGANTAAFTKTTSIFSPSTSSTSFHDSTVGATVRQTFALHAESATFQREPTWPGCLDERSFRYFIHAGRFGSGIFDGNAARSSGERVPEKLPSKC
jgi:hypothetical protein